MDRAHAMLYALGQRLKQIRFLRCLVFLLRLLRVGLTRLALSPLCLLPLQANKLFFYLYSGTGYSCNLGAILCELTSRKKNLQIIWATPHPQNLQSSPRANIRVVKARTLKAYFHQLTARAVIVSDHLPPEVPRRPAQFLVNAWHGGMNYKRIGPQACQLSCHAACLLFRLSNPCPNVVLAGSRFFAQDMAQAFGYPEEIFCPTGLPRNDALFKPRELIRNQVCRAVDCPPDCRLALYAPTFRKDAQERPIDLDLCRICAVLSETFGGKWQILYRAHSLILHPSGNRDHLLDVSHYPEMSDLLIAADVLISDYSSCLWDYALTHKPAFVYAPDYASFQSTDRSFAYPPKAWPWPICQNFQELESAIRHFDAEPYQHAIANHLRQCGSYDTGFASKKAVDLILSNLTL